MVKQVRVAALGLLLLLAGLAGCRVPAAPPAQASPAGRVAASPPAIDPAATATLEAREVTAEAPATETLPLPQAVSLDPAAVQALLSRLPKLLPSPHDKVPFAMRPGSLPAPQTGERVTAVFPPPQKPTPPETAPTGPLEVLRHGPEGDVDLAPELSITFNQPMVPLSSLAVVEGRPVPVKLEPQPPGKWHWIGTKTLQFIPDKRFPMATTYHVTVPAGTVSETHGKLAAAVSWTFTTPPLRLQNSTPDDGPIDLHPVMVAVFNQAIHADEVMATVHLTGGTAPVAVVPATADDVKQDARAAALVRQAMKDRYIAFRAAQPLSPATRYQVTIGPGAPSAEGPLKTTSPLTWGFYTYGPLTITHRWPEDEATPLSGWSVEFSNPLDTRAFRASMVHVAPEVPYLKVSASGDTVSLQGQTRGRTTYTVTFDADLPDVFGQTLGKPQTVTFRVGSARPSLTAPGGNFVIADPGDRPTWSVFTINQPQLKVRLYAVGVEDWARFAPFMQAYTSDKPLPVPGRLVETTTVATGGQPDALTETRIELTPALSHGYGQVIAIVEPPVQPPHRWEWQQAIAWIQVTHIGLDNVVDAQKMVGWATALKDGTPLAGVSLSLYPDKAVQATDASGLATLELPASLPAGGDVLMARQGDDLAFLPQNTSWWSQGGWYRQAQTDELRWFVFDDRKLYRPAEEVHLKGWMRLATRGTHGDIEGVRGAIRSVRYNVIDSRNNSVLKGTAPVDATGGFALAFKLPGTMNLGNARVDIDSVGSLNASGRSYQHSFQVQEFRRPEFEVTATAGAGPFLAGQTGRVTLDAHYYAGGGLPNADVTWSVQSVPGYYTPPDTDGFSFGTWVPWWGAVDSVGDDGSAAPSQSKTVTGHTDASGKDTLELTFPSARRPMSVTVEGTVMDVNRQAWTASTSLLVHPATVYVGLKTERSFVDQGQPIDLQAIVTDIDGKRLAGRKMDFRMARLDWTTEDGQYRQVEADAQTQTVTSEKGPVTVHFKTGEGGTYVVHAIVSDDQGRQNQSDMTVWVAGGKQVPSRNVQQQRVTLIPDRKTYGVSDTASLLVQAPFVPAHGLLTVSRSGIVETRPFTMTSATTTLKVPMQAWYVPDVTVQVDLVGAAPRTSDQGVVDEKAGLRPAYASGTLSLSVPPVERQLKLSVKPQKPALSPGAQTWLDISLKDDAGRPVAGQVALVVVDEAVLALTHYDLSDPMGFFYSGRGSGTSAWHSRANIVLVNPAQLQAQSVPRTLYKSAVMDEERAMAGNGAAPPPPPEAPMPAMAKAAPGPADRPAQAPIQMRSNMNALALFASSVRTDASGHARVAFKLPDNLTRYRIMAVAAAGDQKFGDGRGTLVARLPLMVRPSPPRFLNFGDRFELPVVLQNQTDAPMTVSVAVRATNLQWPEGTGKKVTVPANDRVEVRFPASAVEAGTVRVQVAGASGSAADAASFTLPCWTPATTEAFAVYGTIDKGGITQPVQTPPDVFPQFGGLEVTTSSTALSSLTDALLYLEAYPFECAEQVSSRVLGVAALRDVLAAFKAPGLPTPKAMQAAMARDIEKLAGLQNDDGGFAFWHKGDESWPYISIHVAHALQVARMKGYKVPDETMNRSREYLRSIESHIPAWYGIDCRRALIAYALNVRALMGDRDPARARQLVDEAGVDHLSVEAQAWVLPLLKGTPEAALIRRYFDNHASETAADANFTVSYQDGEQVLLASDRRADAIVLAALIEDQPQNDIIPKLVHGLLDHREKGRWDNTQENVFVLLALDSYFHHYENVTPDYVARVWLGNQYAGDHTFKGHTTEQSEIDVPMAWLAGHAGQQNLILTKTGPGRLYYRLGMSYAPKNLKMPPADYGFTVDRRYEAIDHPEDVRRDGDGAWHIKAGARVRVHLTLVATSRRYHVALVDPLPAGLEAVNPELATSGTVPARPMHQERGRWGWWWTYPWYEHQNLRDERAEAFTSLLWEGVYSYEYVARATTPGTFVVPPPKAEEMYHPETFGRGASDRVIVQ